MNYCTSHDAVAAEDRNNSTIPWAVDNDDDGDGDDAINVAENNPKMVAVDFDSIKH